MVTIFTPRLITLFSDNKYARLDNGEISGGKFLIAQYDRLFCVESDFQVGESNSLYHACGIGDVAALGSLHTTEKMNISPVDRIRLALQAATKLVPGVEPPFYIVNTKNNDVVRLIPLQINSCKNQQMAGQINQQNMILEKSRKK